MAKEHKKPLESDIKKLCYCCQENPSSLLLWNRNGDNETFGQIIQNCFCIENRRNPNDGKLLNLKEEEFFSNNGDVICVHCVDQLQAAVKFKQQVTCAQNKQMCVSLEEDSTDIEPPKTQHIVNPDDIIKLENKKYQCRKCEKVLDDYVNTLQHMNKVHYENTSHKCEECDEQFVSQNKLDKHRLEVHTESRSEKPFEANSLIKLVKRKNGGLNVAKSTVPSNSTVEKTTTTQYYCNKCSKKFDSETSFVQHERSHREKPIKETEKIKQNCRGKLMVKPKRRKLPPLQPEDYTTIDKDCLSCKHCNITYKRIDSLLRHVNSKHRGIPALFCEFCDEKFQTKIRLNMHKTDVHNIDLRCVCNACGKVFWTETTLNVHRDKFHKLGKEKKCPYCEYTTYYNLSDHITQHTKEIRFRCPHCPKVFSRQDTHRNHVRIHTGDKRQVCKLCGEKFVQWTSLIYHIKKHHPNDIEEAKGNKPSDTAETQMTIGS